MSKQDPQRTGFGGLMQTIPPESLSAFHEKVLELVSTVGIQVDHEQMLRRLADFQGVRISGHTVTFNPDLVDRHVFRIAFDLPAYYGGSDFLLITGNMNPTIKDLQTGIARQATTRDLVEATKLEDSLGITGTAAVSVSDVPKHMVEVTLHKILWENSRFKGNDIFEHNSRSTIPGCRYIHEMAQVMNKRFTVGLWFESPRRFNHRELEVVYHYLDTDVPLWVGSFPMYGVTAPVYIESGMAQSAAELFAGYLMLRLLHGDAPVYIQVIDSIMGHPVNWRFANVVYSTIEDILKTVYQISLNNFYNIPLVGVSVLSNGKEEDCQQGFEKGVHTLIAALLGARAFRTAGLLAQDMLYSPVQLVLDHEMLRFIQTLLAKRAFDPSRILVGEIAGVAPGGTFLEGALTLENFRREYSEFPLFDSAPGGQGAESLTRRALDVVRDRIARHEYHIPGDRQRELDRIYSQALHDRQLIDAYA